MPEKPRNGRRQTENLSETAIWCRAVCVRCGCERGEHSHRLLRCPDRRNRFGEFLSVTFVGSEELEAQGSAEIYVFPKAR